VQLNNALATVLGTTTVTGGLTVTSGGTITQTGAATVGGLASFAAGGGNVFLGNAANNFSTVLISNAGSASVTDTGGFTLAGVAVNGNLALSAGGTVSQSGALSVGGSLSLVATASGVDFLLGHAGNAIHGAVTFSGTLANVNDVLLRNTSPFAATPNFTGLVNLGNLTLDFPNRSIVLSAADIDGNLQLTTGGSISQTGIITVGD
jgi:trimeric autotransporter adhesin